MRERQSFRRFERISTEGHENDVWISRTEQPVVFDDDRGAQFIRLLRQRIPPVDQHDLAGAKCRHYG